MDAELVIAVSPELHCIPYRYLAADISLPACHEFPLLSGEMQQSHPSSLSELLPSEGWRLMEGTV